MTSDPAVTSEPTVISESAMTSPEAGERATPFYCPYCGDEDLRPHDDLGGSWHCRGCARVFTLKFVGLEVQ